MSANALHEKFLYHLEEMYYVESRLVHVLGEMAENVANDDLRDGIEEHREQTKDHVTRLEDVFETLDVAPEERQSPTFDGLVEEREQLLEMGGDEDLQDLHELGAAAKTEYLEIAGYENLIVLARKLDLSRGVRDKLEENLDEEKQTKKQLKAMADDSTVRKLFARLAG